MKKILVALDGSPRSEGTLAYALSLSRLAGAKLILFRAFSVPPDLLLAWPLPDGTLEAELRRRAQAYLDEQERRIPPELTGGTRVTSGVPWVAVCAAGHHESVDLIVIGSHGYSGLDHVLGTTAARIVNHADRPVLVVRPIPALT